MRCPLPLLPPLLSLLPIAASAAQLEVLSLPNWQRVPVGEQAVLEGGAVVARVHGPAAGFTNPAGLARLDRPSVSGTVTALEYTRVGARAIGDRASSDDIQLKPNLVGFANTVADDDPTAGGWSMTLANPTQWSSAIEVRSTAAGGGTRSDDGRSTLEMSCLSLAYGRRIGGAVDAGLALETWLVDYRYDSGTSAQDGTTLLTSTYTETGRRLALRLAGGAQVEAGTWHFGAMLRSPGWVMTEQGKINSSTTSGDGSSTTLTQVSDETVGFAMPLPWSCTLGVAWWPTALPGFEMEADLAITGGAADEAVFSPAHGSSTTISSGPTTTTPFELSARRLDLQTVFNPRLGLSYRLAEPVAGRTVRLHLGGYIEKSPVDSSDVFTRLDLLGGTAGITAVKGPMLVGLGGVYVTSSSIGDTIGFISSPGSGLTPQLSDSNATFAVRSFVLTISSSYRF